MKTIRNLIAIFIACVFILGACKKTTTSDQKPKFDNSMLGLWLITKSVGTTPFAVNDSFVVRNDKFNSGYDTKSSIDTIQNRITIYDYLGNSTAWNITKNSSEEFQLDNGSGSMLLKKLRDAPFCQNIEGLVPRLGSFQEFAVIGFDLPFLTETGFKSNKIMDYNYPEFGQIIFPGLPPPANNSLRENDTLTYQSYKLSCNKIMFLYKSDKWVKQ